jgi:hypothetical protein
MMMSRLGVAAAFVSLAAAIPFAAPASAEPAFLSKQYTRCTSCHISPTGGGLLSSYGRSLSSREISLSGNRQPVDPNNTVPDPEAQFLWGALGNSLGPVQLGVEVRPSHLRSSFADFTVTRNIVMNADIIAAVEKRGWTLYGEAGREPSPTPKFGSYEHWAGYQSESGIGFRVGRFFPAYGVRFADHTSYNRANLGFDKYDQVYGLELSRNTSRSFVQVTLAPGMAKFITDDSRGRSFNASARWQLDLGPSMAVVGSGIYRAESEIAPKQGSAGLALGFAPTQKLTIWSQGDVKGDDLNGASFVFVNETAYEAVRGLWLKVSPQLRTESGPQPRVMRLAVSAEFLPRTHINVGTSYYRDKPSGSTPAHTWLLQLHLYL